MDINEYVKILRKARNELPNKVFEESRFIVPKASGFIQGKKTIITNFHKIADAISRDKDTLLRYLDKELATKGNFESENAVFLGKFSMDRVSEKIDKFIKEFVLCRECGKPDTKILKEDRITFIKCAACGAKKSVRM